MFQTKCSSASTLSQTVRFDTNRGSPSILVSVLPVPGSPEPSIIQTNPGIRLPEPVHPVERRHELRHPRVVGLRHQPPDVELREMHGR